MSGLPASEGERAAPVVVFYVTGHGFGHASRVIEIVNAFLARCPHASVHVRTSAPRWLFELTVRGPFTFHQVECDTGVVQIDSLTPDIPATVDRAAAFYRDAAPRVAAEAGFLRRVGAALVVADIPPLAIQAAASANVPAVATSNFTWDWIYEGYAPFLGEASWLPARLRGMQATAVEAWRLPMHGPFAPYARVIDLPFVARHAHRDPADVRQALEVPASKPAVLVSFGGFGLDGLPLERVAADRRFTFITTDVPRGDTHRRQHGPVARRLESGVVALDEHALYGSGLRYEDIVAAADVVVTKPGYGIIAECIANGTAILYTSRGAFAEYDVLVTEMPRYLRCGFIGQTELREGRWVQPLEAVLRQAPPRERPRTDGADVAAARAAEMVG